jgi:hypothetical protein
MSLLFPLFDEDDPAPPKPRKGIPDTFVELALARYVHKGAGQCRACGVRIEWFCTPGLHTIPMSYKKEIVVGEETMRAVTSDAKLEAHFIVCPSAERFRRKTK